MTTRPLTTFQDAFSAALVGREPIENPVVAQLAAQPAFAVYRNGVMKNAIDALQASYPAVNRLVGDAWFRAAAAEFVAGHPPSSPMLVHYGRGFADFLAGFAPAAELPYLADVARLDRCWTEAHVAASVSPLDAGVLATLDADALAVSVLVPHPAARWRWFDTMPIYTLWHCNRSNVEIDPDLGWRGEGALLTRPESYVLWHALTAADCAFLDACAAGEVILAAAQAALAVDPDTDLAQLLTHLLTRGAFRALQRLHLSLGVDR